MPPDQDSKRCLVQSPSSEDHPSDVSASILLSGLLQRTKPMTPDPKGLSTSIAALQSQNLRRERRSFFLTSVLRDAECRMRSAESRIGQDEDWQTEQAGQRSWPSEAMKGRGAKLLFFGLSLAPSWPRVRCPVFWASPAASPELAEGQPSCAQCVPWTLSPRLSVSA